MDNSRPSFSSHDLRYNNQPSRHTSDFSPYGRQSKTPYNHMTDINLCGSYVSPQPLDTFHNNRIKSSSRSNIQSYLNYSGQMLPQNLTPNPNITPRPILSARYLNSQELEHSKVLHLDNLRMSPSEALFHEISYATRNKASETPEEVIIEENASLHYFRDKDSEASVEIYEETTGLGLRDTSRVLTEESFKDKSLDPVKLRDSLEQSHRTVGTLSSELSKAQFRLTELTTKLKTTAANQLDVTDKLKSVTIRCIQAEKNVAELSNENLELRKKLALFENHNRTLEIENDTLVAELKCHKQEWDNASHRHQAREKAIFAKDTLDTAMQDARQGISTLLKGVDGVKQVSAILATLDKYYVQTESPNYCKPNPGTMKTPPYPDT